MTKQTLPLAGLILGAVIGQSALAADVGKLALDVAEDYRARAAFPEWSRPVLDAVDPVASARVPTRQRMSGPEGAAPALETWASTMSAQPGESLDLFARLDWLGAEGLDGLAGLRSGQLSGWTVSAELIMDQVGTLAKVELKDDGQGADGLAEDGIFSTRLTLDEKLAPALGTARNVMVKLHAENAAGDVRRAAGGFLYSHPGARLTGNYRQSVEDGNLVVWAQAEVLAPGRYHLSGTLDSALGAPVATAQAASRLEPGMHWLALPFYGAIFHQIGKLSDLGLASITLATTNGMPNALGPVLRDAYQLTTPPLAELRSEPFNDAGLLESAQRLEGSVAPVEALHQPLDTLPR